ncbi:MAG: redoxin domain-containing protein [Planctomycetota bacterium]|jgi:rhodanese-related sulfurtransferase/peroxiredoxin
MKTNKFKKLYITALSVLILTTFQLSAIEVGIDAPDFTLKTHDSKSLTLSKLEGKRGAVLVFFATWCPGCMAEVPHVKELVKESRKKNILVYGVNVQQPLRVVEKFVKQYDVNYRVLLDPGTVAEKYGVRGIPYIVGINGKGKIIYAGHDLPEDSGKFIKDLNEGIGTEAARDPEKVIYITKEKLIELKKSDKKLVIVDVLSPESYNKRHIEGAINIPLKQIKDKMSKLPKDGTIVTYCANFKCKASTMAAQALQRAGYKNVYDYEGGIKDWHENKLPVKEGE